MKIIKDNIVQIEKRKLIFFNFKFNITLWLIDTLLVNFHVVKTENILHAHFGQTKVILSIIIQLKLKFKL